MKPLKLLLLLMSSLLLSSNVSHAHELIVEVPGKRSMWMSVSDFRFFFAPPPDGVSSAGGKERKAKPSSVDDSNKDQENICTAKSTDNPVIIATGEKYKEEIDFVSSGLYGLSLQRTYRSQQRTGSLFGPNWSSSLDGITLMATDYRQNSPDHPKYPQTVVVTGETGTKFAYTYYDNTPSERGVLKAIFIQRKKSSGYSL